MKKTVFLGLTQGDPGSGHFEDAKPYQPCHAAKRGKEGATFRIYSALPIRYMYRRVFAQGLSDSGVSSSILHGPSDATATSSSRTCSFVDRCSMSLDRQGYRQFEART